VLCNSPLSKSVRLFLNFWRLWLLDVYYVYYVLNPQNTQKHTRNSHCFWTRHYNQSSWSKPATKSTPTPYLDSLGTNFWHQGNCSTIRFLLNIEHGRSGQLMSLSYLSKPKLQRYSSMAVSKFHRTNMILWLVTFFNYTFLPSNPQHPKHQKQKRAATIHWHPWFKSKKLCGEFAEGWSKLSLGACKVDRIEFTWWNAEVVHMSLNILIVQSSPKSWFWNKIGDIR